MSPVCLVCRRIWRFPRGIGISNSGERPTFIGSIRPIHSNDGVRFHRAVDRFAVYFEHLDRIRTLIPCNNI